MEFIAQVREYARLHPDQVTNLVAAVQGGISDRVAHERQMRMSTEVALSLALAPRVPRAAEQQIRSILSEISSTSCLSWKSTINELEYK